MIQPTVGRVVWFRPDPTAKQLVIDPDQPLSATIAFVHNSELVNLTIHAHDGNAHPRRNVRLVHEGECPIGCCTWMPYQRGQAAKTDSLEPTVLDLGKRVGELEARVGDIEGGSGRPGGGPGGR